MVFKDDCLKGKVVLMTGGTRGGMLYHSARAILAHGARGLVMVARDEHKVRVIARQLSDEYGVKVLGFHIHRRVVLQ